MNPMPPIAGYIYLVTNLIDGKKYVGLSQNIQKRWGEHRSAAKRGSPYPLHRAMRKYGVSSFAVKCLETVTTNREDLCKAEIRQIAAHDCLAPKGYNLTTGGEGVDYSVPGVRERMVEGARLRSASPEWQKNVAEAALRRADDPACQAALKEGCVKRSATTEWQEAHAGGLLKRAANPEWRENLKAAAQKKAADPAWQKAQAEGMLKRSGNLQWKARLKAAAHEKFTDPEQKKANAEHLNRARTIRSAQATAKDAHLPIEERERRIIQRERSRISAAKKRLRDKQGKDTSP